MQVVQRALEVPTETPLFAGGKDVFGRPPMCRACHLVVNSLNARLVPALMIIKAKEDRRRGRTDSASRRVEYGLYETTIEQYVASACTTQDLWHMKDVRKNCQTIMEAHEDEVLGAYSRWVKKGAPEAAGSGGAWSWNWEVCYKATQSCGEELAMHALAEFDDDGSGAAERKYRSEPVPSTGTKQGGLLQVVAGSFYDVMVKDDAVDTLAYTAFPNKGDGEFHGSLLPALVKVAELFDGDPATRGTLAVGMVDAENNDVPPPYGTGTKAPTLCLYPAGNKGWPRYISDMNDGRLSVYDVLYFVMNTGSRGTSAAARDLMSSLPADVLHHKAWDHDDL
jgi:hypothetical protein